MASNTLPLHQGRAARQNPSSSTHPSSRSSATRWCCMCSGSDQQEVVKRRNEMKHSIRKATLLCGAALLAWPALAADVTPDRLANPDKEPQNWLTNHRTYD